MSNRFILAQRHNLADLGVALAKSLYARATGYGPNADRSPPTVPGARTRTVRPPLSHDLIDAYVSHLEIPASRYERTVPPHLFPQWSLGAVVQGLVGLPLPLRRALNGGCHMNVQGPIPRDVPLTVDAQLVAIHAQKRSLMLVQRVTTRLPDGSVPVDAFCQWAIPYRALPKDLRAQWGAAAKLHTDGAQSVVALNDEKPELALQAWQLRESAAQAFAVLTGDINPIHWLPAAARKVGFPNVILHGFATFARTYECLVEGGYGGHEERLGTLAAAFKRPLVLPAQPTVWVSEAQEVWVADDSDAAPYLRGHFHSDPQPFSPERPLTAP